MKKNLIILIGLLITTLTWGQEIEINPETGKCFVEEVVQIENQLEADILFTKAQEWVSINYVSAQAVVQYADNNKIILKGSFSTNMFMKEGWLKHTLILQFKDGRFKYNFTDLVYTSMGTGDMAFESKKMGFKKKIYKTTEGNILASIKSLTKYFTEEQIENNW